MAIMLEQAALAERIEGLQLRKKAEELEPVPQPIVTQLPAPSWERVFAASKSQTIIVPQPVRTELSSQIHDMINDLPSWYRQYIFSNATVVRFQDWIDDIPVDPYYLINIYYTQVGIDIYNKALNSVATPVKTMSHADLERHNPSLGVDFHKKGWAISSHTRITDENIPTSTYQLYIKASLLTTDEDVPSDRIYTVNLDTLVATDTAFIQETTEKYQQLQIFEQYLGSVNPDAVRRDINRAQEIWDKIRHFGEKSPFSNFYQKLAHEQASPDVLSQLEIAAIWINTVTPAQTGTKEQIALFQHNGTLNNSILHRSSGQENMASVNRLAPDYIAYQMLVAETEEESTYWKRMSELYTIFSKNLIMKAQFHNYFHFFSTNESMTSCSLFFHHDPRVFYNERDFQMKPQYETLAAKKTNSLIFNLTLHLTPDEIEQGTFDRIIEENKKTYAYEYESVAQSINGLLDHCSNAINTIKSRPDFPKFRQEFIGFIKNMKTSNGTTEDAYVVFHDKLLQLMLGEPSSDWFAWTATSSDDLEDYTPRIQVDPTIQRMIMIYLLKSQPDLFNELQQKGQILHAIKDGLESEVTAIQYFIDLQMKALDITKAEAFKIKSYAEKRSNNHQKIVTYHVLINLAFLSRKNMIDLSNDTTRKFLAVMLSLDETCLQALDEILCPKVSTGKKVTSETKKVTSS